MQTPEDQKEETSHYHTVGFARGNGKRKQNCALELVLSHHKQLLLVQYKCNHISCVDFVKFENKALAV